MKKGETLEQEAARLKAKNELPGRIQACTKRVEALAGTIKGMLKELRIKQRTNSGGENNGML